MRGTCDTVFLPFHGQHILLLLQKILHTVVQREVKIIVRGSTEQDRIGIRGFQTASCQLYHRPAAVYGKSTCFPRRAAIAVTAAGQR